MNPSAEADSEPGPEPEAGPEPERDPGAAASAHLGRPETAASGQLAGLETAASGQLAREAIERLAAAGQTLAVAESLTGGLVAAALTTVAGSSAAFRGGIVAYATELKTALLGVPADLLAAHGPVYDEVARAMALGVRDRLGATYGLGTTGVAGPGPADGHPAGTVYISVAGHLSCRTLGLSLAGDRNEVRAQTVQSVLSLLVRALREDQG